MLGEILSNRYLVTAEVGAGGMGYVYRATDLRTGGDVAVKVPHAYLARNQEFLDRLRREAQIAASLYSPRVVRVVDLDTHEGLLYLVMEYVPGDTLADVLRQRGRLTLPVTLAIGLEVARAMDAAHTSGQRLPIRYAVSAAGPSGAAARIGDGAAAGRVPGDRHSRL